MYRIVLAVAVLGLTVGCTNRELVGGAAVGGAAYEYSNKRAIDELEREYRAGRIDREEYERRRNEIQGRSLVY